MEIFREDLDHRLEQVLLRDRVVAANDLVHQGRQDALRLTARAWPHAGVVLRIDALQLREATKVGTHQHLQLLSFMLARFLVARLAALHADPQAVHLHEVAQDAVYAVVHVAAVFANMVIVHHNVRLVAASGVWELVLHLADEEVAQKEAAHGMLDAFAHFESVVNNLFSRSLLRTNAAASHQDHEVQTWNERRRVLHLLVELLSAHTASQHLAEVALHIHQLLANCGPCGLKRQSCTQQAAVLRIYTSK